MAKQATHRQPGGFDQWGGKHDHRIYRRGGAGWAACCIGAKALGE